MLRKTLFLNVSEQIFHFLNVWCLENQEKKENQKKVLEQKKFWNPDLKKCVGGRT